MCKFNVNLKDELVEALSLTEEQLKMLDESKFDELLTESIKKNLNKSEQSETESQTEKEIEMNAIVETQDTETTTSTALAKVKSPTARKAISVFAKVAAGVLFSGTCAAVGAAHHKEVNKTIKKARKKVGKVIPALAPKPWYKF